MAEALVGGAFLSASLQVLFDRLASREVLNLFRKRTSNVEGLLKNLKRKLLVLNAVLDDADFRQFTSAPVREWLDEAKDVVFEADDLLGEVSYEGLRCKVESDHDCQGSSSQVKDSIFSSSTPFEVYIEPKLEEMIQSIQDLIQEAGSLGLKEGVQRVNMANRFPSSSLVVVSDVYGRNSEKEKLIKLLLPNKIRCDRNEIDVIPIVAMGGMGKTTLAQLAYNDARVGKHFELKAWVCVSEEFDVSRVTKSILESISKCTCNGTDLNQIQGILKEKLNGRKFLLVLDDVWNENYDHWDILRAPFRTGAFGSKIIVTSRSQNTASIMKTGPVINLPQLSDDYCWSLFSQTAFGPRNPSCYPLLEEIGKKIVKRCKGLPLAAKSLGGLLRSKLSVEEWDGVLKSKVWDLPTDKNSILPALRLSYHYLPSHLKQCFAICSLFPKSYEFREEKLVSLWIAEKFVVPLRGKDHEMEGKKCFRELLSMSFFQRSGRNVSCFVMHDLIHDLAQLVSGQFSSRLDDEKSHEISRKTRHFSYCVGLVDGFQHLQAAKDVDRLQTFLPIHIFKERSPSIELDDAFLLRQKQLRVLFLSNYRINELPDGLIGRLIHLHYLDLSFTSIEQLPESICRLYNLDTLLLVQCTRLTTLPVRIGRLFSLRLLDVTGTNLREMPMQMRLLKGLEILSKFVVGKSSGLGIDGLKDLSRLRGKLQISGLENVKDSKDALETKLKVKNHLETLDLGWGRVTTNDSQCQREILGYLRPHTNLKALTIRRYGGTRFPDWLGDHLLCQMVSLRIENCKNCFYLPPLGQLPCLKELTIIKMTSVIEVGEEFCGSCSRNRSFNSLERLCFEDMFEWVTWRLPGTGEFPKLRTLLVINCPKLVGDLPGNTGSTVIEKCFSLKGSVPTYSSFPSRVLVLSGSKGAKLNWQGMSELLRLELSNLPSLQVLTSELGTLAKLNELRIRGCPNLLTLSEGGLPPTLTGLDICECELLQSVVDGTVSSGLRSLKISNCPSLVSFAANGLPLTLSRVEIHMCPKLKFSLSDNTKSCSLVAVLVLYGCLSLKPAMLPKLFPNLQMLCIGADDANQISILRGHGGSQQGVLVNVTSIKIHKCKNLKSLPKGMYDLVPSLERMEFVSCPRIESFDEAGLPYSLRSLVIRRCEKLVSCRSGWGLQRLPLLKTIRIESRHHEFFESFPEESLLPSTLTELEIRDFQDMKTLNWRGLQQLTSLRDLYIRDCPQLQSLPEEGLPPSISSLRIRGCPLLTPRCKKDKQGDDWVKIARIPSIQLDGQMASSSRPPLRYGGHKICMKY